MYLRARELVGPLQIRVRVDTCVGDDENPVLDVVKRHDRVKEHEAGIILPRRGRVARGPDPFERRFEPTRRVVSQESHCPTRESRETGHERRLVVAHHGAEPVDKRARCAGGDAVLFGDGDAVPGPEHEERILAEEGVPGYVLSPFDTLEEERVIRVLSDFQKRGQRRQQVGPDLLADRHERATRGQLLKRLERGVAHAPRSSTWAPSAARAAVLNSSDDGREPHHHSNWRTAWATSISSPQMV